MSSWGTRRWSPEMLLVTECAAYPKGFDMVTTKGGRDSLAKVRSLHSERRRRNVFKFFLLCEELLENLMSSSCLDWAVDVFGNSASGIRKSKIGRVEFGSTNEVDEADEEDSEEGELKCPFLWGTGKVGLCEVRIPWLINICWTCARVNSWSSIGSSKIEGICWGRLDEYSFEEESG